MWGLSCPVYQTKIPNIKEAFIQMILQAKRYTMEGFYTEGVISKTPYSHNFYNGGF